MTILAVLPVLFYFKDWDESKAAFIKQADERGYTLTIKGDLEYFPYPLPRIKLSGITLTSKNDPDIFIHIPAAKARLGFKEVILFSPSVISSRLELFSPRFSAVLNKQKAGSVMMSLFGMVESGDLAFPKVPHLVVHNGTLNYSIPTLNISENIRGINGHLGYSLDRYNTRLRFSGNAFEFSLTSSEGRNDDQSIEARFIKGKSNTLVKGLLSGSSENPNFKGTIEASLDTGLDADEVRRAPLTFSAPITWNDNAFVVENLQFAGDDARGGLNLRVLFTNSPNLILSLDAESLNLDRLLPADAANNQNNKVPGFGARATTPSTFLSNASLYLPESLQGALAINIRELTYKNEKVLAVKTNAEIINQSLTVKDLSALLPGNSAVAATGLIRLGDAATNTPLNARFGVNFLSQDFSLLHRWLGLPSLRYASLANIKQASLQFTGNISPTESIFDNINVTLDETNLTGRIKLVELPDKAPLYSINIAGGNLVVDPFIVGDIRNVFQSDPTTERLELTSFEWLRRVDKNFR